MRRMSLGTFVTVSAVLLSTVVLAGGHNGGHKQIGQYSGFEGSEEQLGAAVAAAIQEVAPGDTEKFDFTGREKELGLAVSKAIKTLNSNSAYQHEMNDALVKMTLQFIQFAKNNDMMEEMVREDAMTQFPMLNRVAKMIEQTGNSELALIAITDQTTCFFQLVGEVERAPGMVSYRAPYGHVLEQTKKLGMHDLTEQEIHEVWTIPHVQIWSEIVGVPMEVSEWNDDGIVTIRVSEEKLASTT